MTHYYPYIELFSRTILTGGGNVFFTDINEEQVHIRQLFFPQNRLSPLQRGSMGGKYQLGFSGPSIQNVLEMLLHLALLANNDENRFDHISAS